MTTSMRDLTLEHTDSFVTSFDIKLHIDSLTSGAFMQDETVYIFDMKPSTLDAFELMPHISPQSTPSKSMVYEPGLEHWHTLWQHLPNRIIDFNEPFHFSTEVEHSRLTYLAEYLKTFLPTIERTSKRTQDYRNRIRELIRLGIDENITLNDASEIDFWTFMESGESSRRAGLALLDNGNLRAVWKGEHSSHLGIQFLGGQRAEYAIFTQRPGSAETSRAAGIDTLDGLKKQLRAFGIEKMV